MYEQQFNPYAANLAVIKGYFKNTKVLVIGILYIVSAVLGLATAIVGRNSLMNNLPAILSQMGMPSSDLAEFNELLTYSSASTISSVISYSFTTLIFTALFVAAFFILYFKSRNPAPEASPKAGATILYVLAVISFVASIVLTVMMVLLFLAIIALSASLPQIFASEDFSIDSSALAGVAAVGFVVIGVIMVIALTYVIMTAAFRKNYYRSVKDSLKTVELQNKGAKGYGVICIINAVFLGIGLLSSIGGVISAYDKLPALLGLLTSGVSLAITILDASIALGYKKYIDDMKYGYNGAPYNGVQAGGYAPAPAQDPYAPQQPYNTYNNYAAPQQPTRDNYSAPAQQDAGYAAPQQPAAPASAFCPHCGAPVDPSAPFCGNCGNRLNP